MNLRKEEYEKKLEYFRLLLIELSYDRCDEGFRYNNQKISKLLNISKITVNKYIHTLQNRNIIRIVNNHYEVGKYCKRINWIELPTSEDNLKSKEIYETIKKNRKIESRSKLDRSVSNIDNRSKIDSNIYSKINSNNNMIDDISRNIDNNINNNITCYHEISYINYINSILNNCIEYLNENIPDDLQLKNNLRYEIGTTGRKRIRRYEKFKGRIYSRLCQTKSGKKEHYNSKWDIPFRWELLEENGYGDYKEIHDITSQIPRLTGFLNNKIEWDCPDIYQMIIDKSGLNIPRNILKQLFMRFYFNDTTPLNNYTRYKRSNDYKVYPVSRNDFDTLNDCTFEIIGNSFQNLIFIYTSILEVLSVFYLKYRYDIRVFNVYDGFYYSDDNIDGILKDIVYEVSIILRDKLVYKNVNNVSIREIIRLLDRSMDKYNIDDSNNNISRNIDNRTYINSNNITCYHEIIVLIKLILFYLKSGYIKGG